MTFRQPFKGDYRITQRYGEHIEGVTVGPAHTGIDYACPLGTPILASEAGTVMACGWDNTGFGYRVIIKHGDGRATMYAHLSKVSVTLYELVAQGDQIGLSGSSGNSTGPHLHFEAREHWNDYKSHFDPMQLPLMSFADAPTGSSSGTPQNSTGTSQVQEPVTEVHALKEADQFRAGDLLKVQNRLGVKAFFDKGFSYDRMTGYQQGDTFFFTGETTVRKDNGLTYMRVIPASFSVWIAVHNEDTQLLDTV